jgi:transketolase
MIEKNCVLGVIKITIKNMRKAFVDTLTDIAKRDPKVILIVGDVGFSYIEDFAEQFPSQYLNVGVTEQSMMGLAAGMAIAGWKPYVYSMIPFVTMRNYEQLRNDVCYHNANVKIIGVRGSVHYKFLGFSHNIYGDEDVKILEGLPNLDVLIPKDADEVKLATELGYRKNNPAYMRL